MLQDTGIRKNAKKLLVVVVASSDVMKKESQPIRTYPPNTELLMVVLTCARLLALVEEVISQLRFCAGSLAEVSCGACRKSDCEGWEQRASIRSPPPIIVGSLAVSFLPHYSSNDNTELHVHANNGRVD